VDDRATRLDIDFFSHLPLQPITVTTYRTRVKRQHAYSEKRMKIGRIISGIREKTFLKKSRVGFPHFPSFARGDDN
jgi:hypothetical protein